MKAALVSLLFMNLALFGSLAEASRFKMDSADNASAEQQPATEPLPPSNSQCEVLPEACRILELVNTERSKRSLGRLHLSQQCQLMAQAHAEDMAEISFRIRVLKKAVFQSV